MSLTWKDATTETTLWDYATRIFLLRGGSSGSHKWRETLKTVKIRDVTFARHNNHKISQIVYLSLFISSFLSTFSIFYFPNFLFLLHFSFIRHFYSSVFSLYNSYIFFSVLGLSFFDFFCLNWSTLSAPKGTDQPSPVFSRYRWFSPNRQSGWDVMLTIYLNLIKANKD